MFSPSLLPPGIEMNSPWTMYWEVSQLYRSQTYFKPKDNFRMQDYVFLITYAEAVCCTIQKYKKCPENCSQLCEIT